jgi:hypothetical protein
MSAGRLSHLRVKLGGNGTFSTRPVMPSDRTLPLLIASSGNGMDRPCSRP